jgi:hypothetical protein
MGFRFLFNLTSLVFFVTLLLFNLILLNPKTEIVSAAPKVIPDTYGFQGHYYTNAQTKTYNIGFSSNADAIGINDKFGVKKIYPTAQGGREWFVNMSDPLKDSNFKTSSNVERQSDGSWRISAQELPGNRKGHVRVEVGTTPYLQAEWKNVEITGYARIVETTGHYSTKSSDLENLLQWYARGGEHSTRVPCEGTSIKGRIAMNGDTSWIKEIWHTGGYTDEKSKVRVASPLVSRNDTDGRYFDGEWFGFKVVIFNTLGGSSVKMEMYLDENADNKWIRVNSLLDSGNWYSDSSGFYDKDCGKPRNYVVTNSGPIVGFRSDYLVWDFKNLSIREIQSPE